MNAPTARVSALPETAGEAALLREAPAARQAGAAVAVAGGSTAAVRAAGTQPAERPGTEGRADGRRREPSADALERAFDALWTYTHGSGRALLVPLDEAVVASVSDAEQRRRLERRLIELLRSDVSSVAREYICGKLALIGSAASAPALAALLADEKVSQAARTTLEALPGADAERALRRALPKLRASAKVGAIDSLGRRADARSVRALAAQLRDADAEVAAAAAGALAAIGNTAAAERLEQFRASAPPGKLKSALADALLACAERLVASGNPRRAAELYRGLLGEASPAHVQLAARRGLERARAAQGRASDQSAPARIDRLRRCSRIGRRGQHPTG